MKPASYLAIPGLVFFVFSLLPLLAPPAFATVVAQEPITAVTDETDLYKQGLFNPNLDYFEGYKRLLPADSKLNLAIKHIKEGKFSEAQSIAQEFIARNNQSAPAYEILGVAQAKLGDIDNALLSFQKAIDISPSQSSAITKMGDLYLFKREKDLAFKAFSKAVTVNPDNYRAHQRLGMLYDKAGNDVLAIDHYEKGLSKTPADYVGIKVDLARLYNKHRLFTKSVKLLAGLITKDSNNATGLIVLGTAYLALDQNAKTEELFKKAVEIDPIRGRVALGIAYRQQGEFDKSLSTLRSALQKEPKSSLIYFQIGETYFQSNEYSKALQSFEAAREAGFQEKVILGREAQIYIALQKMAKAIAIYNGFLANGSATPADYVALAEAYRSDNQIENAEDVYKKLTADYPDIAYSWYQSGLFHGYTMQYDKAINNFHSALSFKKNDHQILKSLAVAYSQAGNYEKAVETARAIVEINSTDPNDLFYLAALLQDGNELQEAEQLYRKIIKLQDNHVLALNNLASILADRKDYDEAYSLASKAVAAAPENGRLLDTLGWIDFQRGRYEEAIKTLSAAVEKAPGIAIIYYHLGASLHTVGKDKAAKEYIEKALTSKASFKGRKDAMELARSL